MHNHWQNLHRIYRRLLVIDHRVLNRALIRYCLTLFILLLTFNNHYGQSTKARSNNIKFENLIIDEGGGLHNNVSGILQDKLGFIWMATLNGLVKYDGYTFELIQYEPSPNSLSANSISTMVQDEEGNLWLGTFRNGINRVNPITGEITRYIHTPDSSSISNNDIRALAFDKNGLLWIATLGGGLNSFNPKTGSFKHYQHQPDDEHSISSNNVIS